MKTQKLVVLLILSFLFLSIFNASSLKANSSYPYLSLSGVMDFVTSEVLISGECEKGTIVLINGELLDIPSSGQFSTKMDVKETNYITIANPSGESLRVFLNFPEMPSTLIKALPKLNFSFNTEEMVLHYGGKMQHKPAGRVSGYVSNEGNGENTSFVVDSDKSFQSDIPLSSGENIIHSYARYLFFIRFTVPDFSVDFEQAKVLKLKIDSPYMYIDGVKQEVDPGRGTKPIILKGWDRTLLPIRAVVEGLGGKIYWNEKERKVTVDLGGNSVVLWIDNPVAEVNGNKVYIDVNNHKVKPIIINDRTMLPIRFVAESLGAHVEWYGNTREVLIVYPKKGD